MLSNTEQVMRLEHERRQAEEDKNAAMQALEQRSREYIMEKEAKKLLEQTYQMQLEQQSLKTRFNIFQKQTLITKLKLFP